jgi:hypothetical protein
MGVHVDRVTTPITAATTRVDVASWSGSAPPSGRHAGVLAFDPRVNDAFATVNRLLKTGAAVSRSTSPVIVNPYQQEWPAGTFLVRQDAIGSVPLPDGLSVGIVEPVPDRTVPLKAPRIGLYHGWGGNMDEGWTRWVLEQFEFSYTSVFDRDVRAGGLRARFDVILLPDSTYDSMLNGEAAGSLPEPYTGGMTTRGIANLREFVSAGGTLVAMDRAAELPIAAFGLPVRDVAAAGARAADFYAPGSILRIRVDPSHPIGYGMADEAAAFFIHSPAFEVSPNAPGARIVAEYPTRDVLMSGWILGERTIAGRAAVVEVSIDKGRVILLGFRTQHRGQSHGTYKLLFNSILWPPA